MKDLIDFSIQYHNDTSLNWRYITDLAAACPIPAPATSDSQAAQSRLEKIFKDGWFKAHTVATAERAVGKPLYSLLKPEEIDVALNTVSSTARSELLFALWRKHRLKSEHLRNILLDIWRYTDFPCGPWCPSRAWIAMFRTTGFLSDGTPIPKRPITIYRGATPKRRRGMAWSTQLWVAEKFADYWYDHGSDIRPGHVYKSRVHPRHILAIMPEQKTRVPKLDISGEYEEVPIRPEFEVIVDPKGLKEIVLVETAKVRRDRLAREGLL